MSINERKTEDLVERRLRKHGYYKPSSGITVEKQSSDTPRVQKLLENASKRGSGVGKPEFLIRCTANPNFIIVIECKASSKKHASAMRNKYADYAVDGALLYASFLAKDFDVLAIAVSGQDEQTLMISHHWNLCGNKEVIDWADAKDILSFDDYYKAFVQSDVKFRQDYNELLAFSRSLNNELQAKKITESDRGFLISGILIALNNTTFKQIYQLQRTSKQLAASLLETIRGEFENANLPENRRKDLTQAFSFIPLCPPLKDRDFFVSLIKRTDENINGFMRTHEYYDTIGQFYVEFLRYANNDKGLGIVLTPPHIAELFSDLADINKESVVFDNCCGTGGLLIAAMSRMILDAGADQKLHRRIKSEQIYGLEFQSKIYALAVSNMVLHGDGKTNIFRGNCFDDATRVVAEHKPTVGVLNPPYKNKTAKEDKEELEYIWNNLDTLEPGGVCVAIVPITCATAPSTWKQTLLSRHTLEAVMSMPIELFHNSKTTVVTCLIILTAHRPHPKGKKTWFGYWRDDGFMKTKHRGRIDAHGVWTEIKTRWVNAYRNRDVIKDESVVREVGYQDEWCAEAYMDTDYSLITSGDLVDVTKRHLINRITSGAY